MATRLLMIVLFFLASAAPGMAEDMSNPVIIKIAGKSEIFKDSDWQEAKEGMRIAPGEKIRIAGQGEVSISASDGKIIITAKDQTTVTYDGKASLDLPPWESSRKAKTPYFKLEEGATTQTQFYCEEGEVEAKVTPGEPFGVVTPLIAASVRGTEFKVTVEPDGSSEFVNQKGNVAVYNRLGEAGMTTDGYTQTVSSNQFVTYLRANGISIPDDIDWRTFTPDVLERLDETRLGKFFKGKMSLPLQTLDRLKDETIYRTKQGIRGIKRILPGPFGMVPEDGLAPDGVSSDKIQGVASTDDANSAYLAVEL